MRHDWTANRLTIALVLAMPGGEGRKALQIVLVVRNRFPGTSVVPRYTPGRGKNRRPTSSSTASNGGMAAVA